jgi:magnesium-transporting ATPase (P-type)
MAFNKKQQIRGIRILLTVFYGFLLSSTLFRYVIHGIVETIRSPTNPYAITRIVIGGLILISIFLATYATWLVSQLKYSFEKKKNLFSSRFDNTAILLVSGVVLIFVFVLTLVFGIIRIVNTAPNRLVTKGPASKVLTDLDGPTETTLGNELKVDSDKYALAEDVTKLTIELIFTLFAILATFALFRYVKGKYAAVPTRDQS